MKISAFVLLIMISACSNIGGNLPDFSLQTIEGETISNSDLEGKIVVINVWATWCGSCVQEIPALNALVDKYSNEDVVFLAFADESTEKVKTFLNRFPFKYKQFANAQSITDKLQTKMVKTYPQNLIIGKSGKVVFDTTDDIENLYTKMDEIIIKELSN